MRTWRKYQMKMNNCGECKHLGECANSPHYFCELIYDLYDKYFEVNPNVITPGCPFPTQNFAKGYYEIRRNIDERI